MTHSERMRVLFLAHAYPRHAGDPVGSFVANLASALRDQGIDVVVSSPSAPGLLAHEVLDGISVHRFRYAPASRETLAYTGTMGAQVLGSLAGKVTMAAYIAAGTLAARRVARQERVDLVHAHWWFPGGLIGAAVSRSLGVPMVVTMHGSDLRLASASPLGRRLYAGVAASALARTAVSSWLAREAEALSPQPVAVAPMPVLTQLFHPPSADEPRDHDRMLFIGKLSAQKGLHRLLDAMARMQSPVQLTVVGAGRVDDDPVRHQAVELGLDHRIEWLPLLTQAELAAQYRRAAVHVIPALDEGLGLTGVESLLSETPVIGFASGGLTDIVSDGRTGRLVPPGDAQAFADALDQLLVDSAARERMGREGRVEALGIFGAAAVASEYAALYRDVLARTGVS